MLQFTFIVNFHLLFQIRDQVLLLNLSFCFFDDIIRKYLNRGNQISINFFKGAYPESCECQAKEIIFIYFGLIRDSVSRNFWFVNFQHDTITGDAIDLLDALLKRLLAVVYFGCKSYQVVECLCWIWYWSTLIDIGWDWECILVVGEDDFIL